MKTEQFIAILRHSPKKQLIFHDDRGNTVPPGYHLTELKAARFDTVDCGGQINRWQETIVQLWVPKAADEDYMTARKFLNIFDKVHSLVPLQLDAEIRVEYGDENFIPSTYHVNSVEESSREIRVALQPPAATCKARDRRFGPGEKAEAVCCVA